MTYEQIIQITKEVLKMDNNYQVRIYPLSMCGDKTYAFYHKFDKINITFKGMIDYLNAHQIPFDFNPMHRELELAIIVSIQREFI